MPSAPRPRRPAVLAWLRLMRIAHKVQRAEEEHLRARGLSRGQFEVLARVGAEEGQVQQRLARSLSVTKGNICQLLDRMQHAGLLQRRQDGRANRVFLTPAGRGLFEVVVPANEALISQRLGVLSPAEQTELLRLLRKLDRGLPDAQDRRAGAGHPGGPDDANA